MDQFTSFLFIYFFFFAAQVLSYEFCHNSSFRLYFVMLFKENNTN